MELSKAHGQRQGAALITRRTKYVALDVHKEATAATVRNARGKVIARSVFPTEEDVFLDFFCGMRGSIHIVFEKGDPNAVAP
jgi:hypothetical protein